MSGNSVTFCTKCGQKRHAGTEPKCVCNSKKADKDGWNSIKNHPDLPSFNDLKDHDPVTKTPKKNHYKAQFQSWKPCFLVSTARHIDCVKAMEDHDSGAKEITFNDAICINKAMAINALIAEMCANG